MKQKIWTLAEHIQDVKDKKRRFETVFETVLRMILEKSPKTIEKYGSNKIEYPVFRQGKKHIVDLHDELNSLVHYIKDAAEGGTSKEMAFVFVSEPGTGKTFLIEYLCRLYRSFLRKEKNNKYTFGFTNLKELGSYGKISYIESQTFEDPMILAMNLFENEDNSKEFLSGFKFSDKQIEDFYEKNRGLGADSAYILNEIRNYCDGNIEKMLDFIKVVPVIITENSGIITGKYAAKDKITSSAIDLVGGEDVRRLLHLEDSDNPYRFNLRRGALARVAGGGIHFADEMFKNKKDLIQVYLGVIQDRQIEIDGFIWPMDTLIIGTSNNEEFNRFRSEEGEAPIISRCRICYVSHVTNYKSQKKITGYALSDKPKKTIDGENLHIDPNLEHTISIILAATRVPHNEKLNIIETVKLAAGEIAGDKSIEILKEIIETLNENPDVTKRFGQKGFSYRDLGRILQILIESPKTNKGKCMFAFDLFKCAERVNLDYINDAGDKDKYKKDIKTSKELYRKHIETQLYNAFRNDSMAIERDVLVYVNMVLAIGADDLDDIDDERTCKYKDPQTGEMVSVKIDKKYIDSVESRLGLGNKERQQTHRSKISKIYGQRIQDEPNYNFMDNLKLVNAVTEVITKSDILGAGSLVGALSNRQNEKNKELYNRIIESMTNKLGYCKTCAEKTIERFCIKEDES